MYMYIYIYVYTYIYIYIYRGGLKRPMPMNLSKWAERADTQRRGKMSLPLQ